MYILPFYAPCVLSAHADRDVLRILEVRRRERRDITIYPSKGKVIPLQARCGPDGG